MAVMALQIVGLVMGFLGLILQIASTCSNTWRVSSNADSVISATWVFEGLWMNCAASALGSVQCKWFRGLLGLDSSCLANNSWKVSTVAGSVITSSTLYENLWKACAKDSTGVSNCRDFESLLALPGYVQGCRALMIVSLLLGLAGVIVALLGLKCTKIGSGNEQTKGKIALTGGVCLIASGYVQGCRALMIVSLLLGLAGVIVALLGLKCTKIGSGNEQTKGKIALTGGVCLIASGLCCIIPVSWYAYQITQEFYNPLYGGTKYELGPALYMGWGGAILAILGGAFLCCSCTGGQKGYKYAGTGQGNQQRIYKASSAGETMSKAYV
ncbi:UNVERIFIED_CONTAM: hypothetical protein FKN15_029316 [Acipenser sinensis]